MRQQVINNDGEDKIMCVFSARHLQVIVPCRCVEGEHVVPTDITLVIGPHSLAGSVQPIFYPVYYLSNI